MNKLSMLINDVKYKDENIEIDTFIYINSLQD